VAVTTLAQFQELLTTNEELTDDVSLALATFVRTDRGHPRPHEVTVTTVWDGVPWLRAQFKSQAELREYVRDARAVFYEDIPTHLRGQLIDSVVTSPGGGGYGTRTRAMSEPEPPSLEEMFCTLIGYGVTSAVIDAVDPEAFDVLESLIVMLRGLAERLPPREEWTQMDNDLLRQFFGEAALLREQATA
jgi:hypothetical protein